MKKSKFDDQFRKEFLANVRPPEGSFEFYEDVLDFNRKKPFYKRNSFVKNLLALCIFIFVVLLTNIVTYSCTINSTFYDNSYEEKLNNYLSDEYNVVKSFKMFSIKIDNDDVNVYLLLNSESKYLIMYNGCKRLLNLKVNIALDEKEMIIDTFFIDSETSLLDSPLYISESFVLNNNIFNFEILDKDTNEILVNFSKNLSLQ